MDDASVIRALGGQQQVSGQLGLPWKTVAMWIFRNNVPPEHRAAIFRLAQQAGLDWTPPGFEGLALVEQPASKGSRR